ncbi:MAG: gamma-glutamyl-gamma-aminobutyrate hydrolase family protein [Luteitalea sp.]|nr:gamma-glutamyl-gamma-aminobutyrate hydrolase family protein [Luteitalea sp.]
MPTIGITACRKIEDYRQAILHSVGDVRIVDHSLPVEAALEGLDGLMLTGGDDVAPVRYGEQKHSAVVEVQPERDDFEIALVKEARSRDLPILAICRGIQVMNVAFGGTLVQDIPSQVNSGVEHRLEVPPHPSVAFAHEIWFEKDSLLGRLLGERLAEADSCEVNSRHHQAVKEVAAGFRVSATAPDGVIEAIEDPSARFCLGVQWHPENFFRTGEFRPLFEGFVEAARTRGKRK